MHDPTAGSDAGLWQDLESGFESYEGAVFRFLQADVDRVGRVAAALADHRDAPLGLDLVNRLPEAERAALLPALARLALRDASHFPALGALRAMPPRVVRDGLEAAVDGVLDEGNESDFYLADGLYYELGMRAEALRLRERAQRSDRPGARAWLADLQPEGSGETG